jgi:hypothetical protein
MLEHSVKLCPYRLCGGVAAGLGSGVCAVQHIHTHTHTHTYIYIYIYILVLIDGEVCDLDVGLRWIFGAGAGSD